MKTSGMIMIAVAAAVGAAAFYFAAKGQPDTNARSLKQATSDSAVHGENATSVTFDDAIKAIGHHRWARIVEPYNSYQTSRDLKRVYDELITRRDAGSVFVASRILSECAQVRGTTSSLVKIADGSMHAINSTKITSAQRSAAQDIIDRCRGFRSLDINELKGARAQLSARLAQNSGVFAKIYSANPSGNSLTEEEIKQVLDAQDPAGIMLISPQLTALWRRANHQTDSKNIDLAQRSFVEVACGLGMECSAESLRARTGCVYTDALCPLGVQDQEEYWVPIADRTKLADFSIIFLQAIRSRDLRVFGIS